MSVPKVRAEFDFSGTWIDLAALSKQFPYLAKYVLARTGFRAARELYEKHLNGKNTDLEYHPRSSSASGAPISRNGRRMVLYSIDKDGKYVSIRSFPLNLFERGRLLRSGVRAAGKFILRKFGRSFNADKIAAEALKEFTMGNLEMTRQAERMIRGSFSRGESPFGDTENSWRGRWRG